MRKFLFIMLALLLSICFFSCSDKKNASGDKAETDSDVEIPAETDETLLEQHKKIKENGSIIGVAYLGKRDPAVYTLGEYLNRQTFWDEYPMFVNISPENFIEERGEDVFLLLPIDGVKTKVYICEYDFENNTYKKGAELEIPVKGKPFFIQGNMVEYTFVVVAEGNGKKVEFLPLADEDDGQLMIEDKLVYDIFS